MPPRPHATGAAAVSNPRFLHLALADRLQSIPVIDLYARYKEFVKENPIVFADEGLAKANAFVIGNIGTRLSKLLVSPVPFIFLSLLSPLSVAFTRRRLFCSTELSSAVLWVGLPALAEVPEVFRALWSPMEVAAYGHRGE